MQFSDKDEHIYFWFPLLAGLSELTFDPRTELRQSALGVRLGPPHPHRTSSYWAAAVLSATFLTHLSDKVTCYLLTDISLAAL